MNWFKFPSGPAKTAWLSILASALSLPVLAGEIVYDNSAHYLEKVLYSGTEYGDEINLGGVARTVTDFIFEYYGDFIPQGDEVGRVRFYANDGGTYAQGYTRPGTLLYESGFFPLDPGQHSQAFNVPSIVVPDTLTWTVEFRGLTMLAGDRAGLLNYNPVTVGSPSRNDFYWKKDPNGWAPHGTTSGVPLNFGARVIAVPEPTSLQFLFASGMIVAGCGWIRRKKSA